jgi:hypothetical protein
MKLQIEIPKIGSSQRKRGRLDQLLGFLSSDLPYSVQVFSKGCS